MMHLPVSAHLKLLLILSVFLSCGKNETAELIILNANLYTGNQDTPRAEAMAVAGGRIIHIGSNREIQQYKESKTEIIDLNGQFVMPGFIEGHGHFRKLGFYKKNLQLLGVASWEETMDLIENASKGLPEGTWILGRGWHQEKWDSIPDENIMGYPIHDELSERVPDHPVMIKHASGHAIFANKFAMDLAGVSSETPNPAGGRIIRNEQGDPIGVFEENAENIIEWHYENYLHNLDAEDYYSLWKEAIKLAEEECLSHGITSFQQAGTSIEELSHYKRYAAEEGLGVRLWIMLRDSLPSLRDYADNLPIVNAFEGFLTVRALKEYLDGALGSRGAWLLEPYIDDPGNSGQVIMDIDSMKPVAEFARDNGLQMCVHAIGDRANRELLDMYSIVLGDDARKLDHRWRIEHAQHIDPVDIPRFTRLGVIPSMQAIHCASDAPFVVERLGYDRAKNTSYPWRSLINSGSLIANGTDVPVEPIDPFSSIYASITRKKEPDDESFFPSESMTRDEAIKSYTIWNAYAAFEEKEKGTLEKGKMADFVVLSRDITACPVDSIITSNLLQTYVGGKLKFVRN